MALGDSAKKELEVKKKNLSTTPSCQVHGHRSTTLWILAFLVTSCFGISTASAQAAGPGGGGPRPPGGGGGGGGQQQPPPAPTARYPELRSFNGGDNNRQQPSWGEAGTLFLRQTTIAYDDGLDTPSGADRPSAREVSNVMAASSGSKPNAQRLTDIFWQWGQFLDHDIDLTLSADPAESFPIAVPVGDVFFDPNSTGVMTIPLSRSAYERIENVRQQVNSISSYIDASMVYGSSEDIALSLRALDGTGRMAVSEGNLLPLSEDGFFAAGDIRVNEQVGLTSIQTLFMREHNFWAREVRNANPNFNDEQIYQLARAIVGAEIQQITYEEFLPRLLGRDALSRYRGYSPNTNATIGNAFATAAYRLGHSMLSSTLWRLNRNLQPIPEGHLPLQSAFFNPAAVSAVGIEPYLRGLVTQRAQELDTELVDDVRNFLFGNPGEGGFDLASLNIQRGRDHGLPGYNQVREDFGLQRVTSFDQISRDPQVRAKLAAAYTSPDQIDLWVGGLAEDHVQGAVVGPTFLRILKDQFERLRDGDRFWYEGYLPTSLLQMVREQNLSRIIRRNTNIGREIQDNVWIAP